jgi:hypothetical protein
MRLNVENHPSEVRESPRRENYALDLNISVTRIKNESLEMKALNDLISFSKPLKCSKRSKFNKFLILVGIYKESFMTQKIIFNKN